MLLSICIPTYNRAEILRYCLENLRALDAYELTYEIVVVDHASTDHTAHVLKDAASRWDNLRYYRQAHPVGIERQFTGCLRMGRGDFTVYVADDDKIIPEKLVQYVRYLQAHPEVSVLYAPWWAYDDAHEKIIHGYFEVPERTTFSKAEPLAMVDFITSKLIFPESGIYRSDALHAVLTSRQDGPYQAFLLAQSLLRRGHVVFETEPYYLEVAVTKPQFTVATRMNVEITLSYLDNMRGAAEIMIERMLLDLGAEKLPDGLRSNVHEALLSYLHQRLMVAFRRALAMEQYLLASELAQRIMLWRGIFQPDLIEIAHSIYALTGVQAAAQLAASESWLKQIYVYGFKQSSSVIDIMKKIVPYVEIAAADAAEILAYPEAEYTLVLVKTLKDRKAFLNSKLLPGNLLVLQELADYYQIIPAPRDLTDL